VILLSPVANHNLLAMTGILQITLGCCGSTISCCCNRNGKCSNLKVIDGGPACYVENNAGGPVIDASYSMCQSCTGSTSCGWSDHVPIHCTKRFASFNETEIDTDSILGPCTFDPAHVRDGLSLCVGELTDSLKTMLKNRGTL